MSYPVLYVIVNTTLPSMLCGKSQAHSGHAASAFMFEYALSPLRRCEAIDQTVLAWMAATPQGFGTQINLQVDDWQDAMDILAVARRTGVYCDQIVDPEYPYIVDNETVTLIAKDTHAQPPICLNPEAKPVERKWLCQREETTAIYVFGMKDEIESLMTKRVAERLKLHP